LAALAHEIRHPLALISSLALVLKSDATQGQRAAEICDLIINEAQLLARLANDLKVER
jgi:signal transduction histidine kinase